MILFFFCWASSPVWITWGWVNRFIRQDSGAPWDYRLRSISSSGEDHGGRTWGGTTPGLRGACWSEGEKWGWRTNRWALMGFNLMGIKPVNWRITSNMWIWWVNWWTFFTSRWRFDHQKTVTQQTELGNHLSNIGAHRLVKGTQPTSLYTNMGCKTSRLPNKQQT